jgi:hypothetical protein
MSRRGSHSSLDSWLEGAGSVIPGYACAMLLRPRPAVRSPRTSPASSVPVPSSVDVFASDGSRSSDQPLIADLLRYIDLGSVCFLSLEVVRL